MTLSLTLLALLSPLLAAQVRATEDAAAIRPDNGLIALDFSKESGTFTGIAKHAADGMQVVAERPEAYYWDAKAEPAPDKGYFRPLRPAVRLADVNVGGCVGQVMYDALWLEVP